MLDLLKKFFGKLPSQPSNGDSELRASVKTLLGRVHLHTKLNGDQVIRSFDDELTAALSDLDIELGTMTADPGRSPKHSELTAAAGAVTRQIDNILSTDVRFRDLGAFEQDLKQLMRLLQDLDVTVKRRRRWLARFALLASIGPLVGYSLHWAIGTYYSAAILEQVDIVYPDTPFVLPEAGEGYYRARYDDIEPYLKRFEDHYFAQTRKLSDTQISLPSVYDEGVAKRWGAPKPAKEQNLFIQRVFIRNIRDTNVVNKLGVKVRRVADSRFFWDRLDVSTDLEITPQRHAVRIATNRAPIKDVSLSFEPVSILGTQVEPQAEGPDHVVTTQTYRPSFGEHKIFSGMAFPVYFRFSAKDIPAGLPDAAREFKIAKPRNQKDLYRRMQQVQNRAQKERLISVPCADNSLVIAAADMDALGKTTTINQLDELTLHVKYALLDDTAGAQAASLQFSEPFVFFDETRRVSLRDLAGCLAPDLEFEAIREQAARAEGPSSIFVPDIKKLDLVARFLADDLRVKGGEIVLEESFYFDLAQETAPTSSFKRKVKILKDGDFVVINVGLLSYPSGIYEFDFLFNDEAVARVRVDPLWPQSQKYKPEDDPFFAADGRN